MEHLQLRTEGDRVLVSGELDLVASRVLRPALAGLDGQRVVLDLAGVTFIDAGGLHALLDIRNDHPGVRIDNVSRPVQRLLDLTDTASELLSDARCDA